MNKNKNSHFSFLLNACHLIKFEKNLKNRYFFVSWYFLILRPKNTKFYENANIHFFPFSNDCYQAQFLYPQIFLRLYPLIKKTLKKCHL